MKVDRYQFFLNGRSDVYHWTSNSLFLKENSSFNNLSIDAEYSQGEQGLSQVQEPVQKHELQVDSAHPVDKNQNIYV